MKKTIKILSVVLMAVVLCVGLIACAHKNVSDHTATGDWLSDENDHWHACEKADCIDAGDRAAHEFDNACDADCNVCGYVRTPEAHVYENACDGDCGVCGGVRTPEAHVFDNDCDTTCNVCGLTRNITHKFSDTLTAGETTHWYECSVCGAKKDEAAHVYDQTVAHSDYFKAEATATTKAQYYKSCVCGKAHATDYFETDKAVATITNIQDLSKTYDKVELANPTYETNSDGAVTFEWYQGDTKLDAKPVNAGTYKVKVNVAETVTYAGVSAEQEFTIAKKVLSNLSVDLTYAGTNSFEVPLSAANGILADDVADGIKVCITFANKNVGAAVTGAGLDADDGDNYTNYELDLTTCTASIVKATITITGEAPVYGDLTYHSNTDDWRKEYSPTFKTGDTGENVKIVLMWKKDANCAGGIAYGHWITVDGVDATNNYNYSLTAGWSSKIQPKPLTNLNFVKEYNGGQVYAIQMTAENGVVDGDSVVINLIPNYVGVSSKVEIKTAVVGNGNYSIDKADCTLQIVPKALTGISTDISKIYDGNNELMKEIEGVNGEVLRLTVQMDSANAGSTAKTYYWGQVSASNYTFNGKTASEFANQVKDNAEITQMTLSFPATKYVAEYTGSSRLTIDFSEYAVEGDTLTMSFEAMKTGTPILPISAVGSYAEVKFTKITYSDTVNYKVIFPTSGYTLEIVPKKITNLDLKVTYGVYDDMYVTLLVKDGIIAGEEVKLMIGQNHATEVEAGTVFTLQQSFGALLGENYEVIASMTGADKNNYELVAYDDGNGNMIYGTLTIVAAHDVQFDGSCACGTSHLTETLTFTGSEVVGASVTIDCDFTYEGGIYKIALEGGKYSFMPSDNFATITVYDEDGEELTSDSAIGGITLTEGTYYVSIGINSSTGTGDKITVKKLACDNVQFDGSCACGNSHLTDTMSVPSGEPVGELVKETVDQFYEGGIYKITLAGGQYGMNYSDQWGYSYWYDSDGNEIEFTSGKAWLDAGDYYIHIKLHSFAFSGDYYAVRKYAKLLDIENEEVIVPEVLDDNNPKQRVELIASYHSGGDRFVIFYEVGNEDVLDYTVGLYYTTDEGVLLFDAGDNIENIEFYDMYGHQLDATWDSEKFEIVHADNVSAVGGVYIVITMNGEGEYLYFGAE